MKTGLFVGGFFVFCFSWKNLLKPPSPQPRPKKRKAAKNPSLRVRNVSRFFLLLLSVSVPCFLSLSSLSLNVTRHTSAANRRDALQLRAREAPICGNAAPDTATEPTVTFVNKTKKKLDVVVSLVLNPPPPLQCLHSYLIGVFIHLPMDVFLLSFYC